MKILIAPDSFKGSLTAIEFCRIAAEQIEAFMPNATLDLFPLADGGEGTIEAVLANTSGKTISVSVQNPLGRAVNARYAVLANRQTAIIEMAQASGLPLLAAHEQNPMITSSYGTGELIRHALDQGCRRFIIALGGSATNDGGTGMLQALGIKFLDAQQQTLQSCGQTLNNIVSIDLSGFDPRIQESELIIAGDVNNPLCGKFGATYVYGPQKGANQKMLAQLETGMSHFAEQTSALFNSSTSFLSENLMDACGAGAAGGMGYALMAYCQATMKSGFELLADLSGLDEMITSHDTRPDLIITGEGRFDNQSLQGKLVGRLSEKADKHNIPLIVICGQIGDDIDINNISPDIRVFSLSENAANLDYSINHSASLLKKLVSDLVKSF